METKQQHEESAPTVGGGGGSRSSSTASAYLCRPSGTRWIPTSEQIRILRDLYYNCGIRSPNSEQIQRIAAMLRQYGKIEGKNVFYWFQNHKARERQKKRLTLDIPPGATDNHGAPLVSPGVVTPSSSSLYTSSVQLETSTSNSPAVTERSFLDYLGVRSALDATTSPVPWTYHSSDQTAAVTRAMARELETLPLFPVNDVTQQHEEQQGQDIICNNSYLSNFHWSNSQQQQLLQEQHHFYSDHFDNQDDAAAAAGASLELTLSSYYCPYPAGSM